MGYAWLAFDGKTYTEQQLSSHETEQDARAAAVALGATLRSEKMSGARYVKDGKVYRIASRGWAPGFILWETVEVKP